MKHHKKIEFEVISNSDKESDSEPGSESESESEPESVMSNEYSQNDKTFLLQLFTENRNLLNEIKEKDKTITELQYRNVYLKNSNIFWIYSYIGSVLVKLISLRCI